MGERQQPGGLHRAVAFFVESFFSGTLLGKHSNAVMAIELGSERRS